jgi:hypothetical protein
VLQRLFVRRAPELPIVVLASFLLLFLAPLHSSHNLSTLSAASEVHASTQKKPKDNGDITVYVTKTGAKYHAAGCSSLRKSAIPMKLRDAAARYGPCKNCRPPVYQRYDQ